MLNSHIVNINNRVSTIQLELPTYTLAILEKHWQEMKSAGEESQDTLNDSIYSILVSGILHQEEIYLGKTTN